jgi:endoglucanase
MVINRKKLTSIADTSLAKQKLLNLIKSTKNNTIIIPYRIPGEYFGWGGNGIYGNRGMLLMQAFTISGDAGYYNAAISSLYYLLGRNATTYCFVTGMGSNSPKNPHHRISSSDGITEPVPGILVGGPNPGNLDDNCGASQYPSTLPARAYLDQRCSYTTNEFAINWYAPIAFLSGAIQYEYLKNFTNPFPSYLIVSTEKINLP